MKGKIALYGLAVTLAVLIPAFGQQATPHGINVTWTASTTPNVTYQVFRCTGTCTASSTWVALCTLNCGSGTSYLDPAAGLSVNATYSYEAQAIDSTGSGNKSDPSNIATVAVGAAFPPNPVPPSGCNAKVQ